LTQVEAKRGSKKHVWNVGSLLARVVAHCNPMSLVVNGSLHDHQQAQRPRMPAQRHEYQKDDVTNECGPTQDSNVPHQPWAEVAGLIRGLRQLAKQIAREKNSGDYNRANYQRDERWKKERRQFFNAIEARKLQPDNGEETRRKQKRRRYKRGSTRGNNRGTAFEPCPLRRRHLHGFR